MRSSHPPEIAGRWKVRRRSAAKCTVAARKAASDRGSAGCSARCRGSSGAAYDADVLWAWRNGLNVHYVRKDPPMRVGENERTVPNVLLLPGFGVGVFHYERNIEDLANAGFRVYAMDLVGQGLSWPSDIGADLDKALVALSAQGEPLVYGVKLWVDQIEAFVDKIVLEDSSLRRETEEPHDGVFVVGNSLGGLLAAAYGARRPDRVRGVGLLNATPFWAFAPHESHARRSPVDALFRALLPWDGALPAPQGLLDVITAFWWDNLRKPSVIRGMLAFVYADAAAAVRAPRLASDETYSPSEARDLIARIVEPTEHPHAAAAFASMAFAPRAEVDFAGTLAALRDARIPVLLCYGRDDPWITPLWAQRAFRAASHAQYVELSPVGHCPHHEAPHAVNPLLIRWMRTTETAQPLDQPSCLVAAGGESFPPPTAPPHHLHLRNVTAHQRDGLPHSALEHLDRWRFLLQQRLAPQRQLSPKRSNLH